MPPPTIQQALEMALQFHRTGRLGEAEALYRQILAQEPDHADALHFLGVIAHQIGRNDLAVDLIRRAIALNPSVADYHSNFGVVLKAIGQFDAAIAACRRAIELKPDDAEAHNNLGAALGQQGDIDEAIAACRRALQLKPDFAEANYNLGNALRNSGQHDEAIAAYQRVIALKPDYADAYINLGDALSDRGRLDEAIGAYRRALQFKPDHAEANNNLGATLGKQGKIDDAIGAYLRAIEIKPDYAGAHSNLGTMLAEQGRIEGAINAYRRALQFAPSHAGIHDNVLLDLHFLPDFDAQALFREHCEWNQTQARPLAKFIEPHTNTREPNRRLRVGYLSPDFREHSVTFFIEGLIASHDRGQVEVFCYSNVLGPDAFTARLQQRADHWREIASLSDTQAAALIRNDRIDILVDLAGHTANNRLLVFARKPAPVQVSYLGYPDTTGMDVMDYRLTDAYADPPGVTDHLHSEKLIRLPDIFSCFRPAATSPEVGPLPALARGHVTFTSFHTQAKMNNRLLEWWAKILQQVPNSRLLMAATGLNESSHQQRLREFFTGRGVDPGRLTFKGRQYLQTYLTLHNEVDLLLDSSPFTGHTISCHALWMGLPVVTLAGDRHCSRMAASVLTTLGLAELVAHTPDEYVKIAADLAGSVPRLAELRSTLRERMQASPVMDAPRFARNVEHAYRDMWRAWCAKHSP